ncbi:LacI family DNA-binding transcriptional regulator [Clostridium tyrobutyricum]|jgi:LacI family kdg operon repressor|uniref:LacI family DNA-binding transcriptional regulator n=1 Tax=Clostridium tyrobutyricum TaxID=1519 RepID=UPI001C389080|nr:LacI family DNA-binding transcriptional regulator [Clostridium tyrobutyricum]MBV4438327.1 LacI family transcriptional regulator [Clostridium tyrobutyricum]MBV4440581.1 LacI family transcriptional regulator [Clostridium tyrobutyricum]
MKEQKKVIIDDVAKKAQVSKSTVSRYLNGKFEFMSEKTRNRIQNVISQLNYRPSNTARTLKLKRSSLIGVVMVDLTNPFSSILIKGIGDECRKHDYNIIITNSDNDNIKEKQDIMSLMDQNIDGLIMNGTGYNEEFLIKIQESGVPVIMLDSMINSKFFDCVTSNNFEMTFNVTNYMIDQGFSNLAMFTPDIGKISARRDRKQAFVEACTNRLDPKNFNVYTCDNVNSEGIRHDLMDFVENYSGSKVAFAINGVTLLNLLQVINDADLKIPCDLGVYGYDDWGWASLISPGITTISQPTYDMGAESAKVLLEKLNSSFSKTSCIYLKSKLKIRGSTSLNKK